MPSESQLMGNDAATRDAVAAANAALRTAESKSAVWSHYSLSHNTFELLVGDSHEPDNIVLSLPACTWLAGPVRWPRQHIEVTCSVQLEATEPVWRFDLRDAAVGFHAMGGLFRWRQGYDLWAYGGLWLGRGSGPVAPLTGEQAEEAISKRLRQFYRGVLGHNELKVEVFSILEELPIVLSRPEAESDPAD